PERWADLADKGYFNTLVAADPTKSGSANKSYEIIVQQAMHEIIPPKDEKHPSPRQMDLAWAWGINRVKRIMANTRTITDSAGSVTREVATGNAAAGTAIDFYGLTEKEWNRVQLGTSPVVEYIPPQGGTCIGADPVQLLRGAPHRKAAEAFLDFIIGPEGQKLLCFKKGVEGGPEKYTLRHSPVRKDLYAKKYYALRTDPDYFPYEAAALSFTYKAQWTGRYFSLIRILIRCVALDVRDELREAWGAIVAAGGPEKVPQAMKEFEKLPFAYHEAPNAAKKLKKSKNNTALDIAATTREWSDFARKQYKEAARLAREGK
ncbi:MAG: ABC transporter substrate-binding protein, partial [Lentisphaeria bacterium]|nr:ABC transporter substrate-binding protein [Lentisphaeria bacterium]